MNQLDLPEILDSLPTVQFPRDLVFPFRPTGTVVLPVETVDGQKYTLLIGGLSQQMGDTNKAHPCVTIRHLRVIVKMLLHSGFDAPEIPIKYAALLDGEGGPQRKQLRKTLDEMANVWIHVLLPDGKTLPAERLVTFEVPIRWKPGVDVTDEAQRSDEKNIQYRYLRKVRFAEPFWRAFLARTLQLRADVLDRLSSDAAVAIYLILAPDAYHPKISEENPGRKDAAKLMCVIGANPPSFRSEIKEFYERSVDRRGGPSLLEMVDAQDTNTALLRVAPHLELNSAGTGYNVLFWLEKREVALAKLENDSKSHGALMNYWLSVGLPFEGFAKAQNPAFRTLAHYETDRITELGYDVINNRRFLELVRSFIGPIEFGIKIGEAHDARRTGVIRETPAKWFGGALVAAFKLFADREAKKQKMDAGTRNTERFKDIP